MNDIISYKNFLFQVFTFKCCHHSDNSHGIPMHYFARLLHGNVRIITNEKKEYFFTEGDVFYLPKGLRYTSHWKGSSDTDKLVEWESYGFFVFPGDDDTKEPIVRWRSCANLLYSNWLNYFVYQSTPYNIEEIE